MTVLERCNSSGSGGKNVRTIPVLTVTFSWIGIPRVMVVCFEVFGSVASTNFINSDMQRITRVRCWFDTCESKSSLLLRNNFVAPAK